MRLYSRNKFASPCAVSGEWVEANAGWRVKRAGRWFTISSTVAAAETPVILDVTNDRRSLCWYCGALVDVGAGVLQVDRSGPHDAFSVLHRDCAQIMAVRR